MSSGIRPPLVPRRSSLGLGGMRRHRAAGGLGKLDMALPFLEEPCIPQEKRKLVSSKDSMP